MFSVILVTTLLTLNFHPTESAIGFNVNFNISLSGFENITKIFTSTPVDPSLAEDAESTTVKILIKQNKNNLSSSSEISL